MTRFLVERYAPDPTVAHDAAQKVRTAARSSAGAQVRLVEAIYLPEEDTSLLFVDAVSADAVRELFLLAELPFDRITEATR